MSKVRALLCLVMIFAGLWMPTESADAACWVCMRTTAGIDEDCFAVHPAYGDRTCRVEERWIRRCTVSMAGICIMGEFSEWITFCDLSGGPCQNQPI